VERLALACTSAGGGGGSSYPLQKLQRLPPQERAAAQLKLADSRWDGGWLEAHPADRALAEGLAAAGQDQRDPAAAAARTASSRRAQAASPAAQREQSWVAGQMKTTFVV